jgi:hypothetical protein
VVRYLGARSNRLTEAINQGAAWRQDAFSQIKNCNASRFGTSKFMDYQMDLDGAGLGADDRLELL